MSRRHRLSIRPWLPEDRPVLAAAICAGIYVVLAFAYIVFSGRIAAHYASSVEQLEYIESLKGRLFVVVTGVLFFLISLGWWRTMRHQRHLLVQSERRLIASMYHAALAHDLNNMLMALSGLMEELRRYDREDEELGSMRQCVEEALKSLSPLASRLAAMSRADVSEGETPLDLPAVLPAVVDLARKHPDVRMCEVRLTVEPGLAPSLDRGLLQQAVLNLVVNAAQATGAGGEVEVVARRTAKGVSLQVHDNGPGIPPEQVGTVFKAGYTSKREGTGLGLLSVRALAASCLGRVEVSRSPLGGALFELVIPAATGRFAESPP